MLHPRPLRALAGAALLLASCSADDPAPACAASEELFEGRCVDPGARYEPESRVDHDNVVAYGDPLTQLALPDPPKSGFRVVAPPRLLQPGEEDSFCLSWPYPAIQNKLVYSARLYTTAGLHHSNVIAKPVNPEYGPNPYPGCHPGADDPFGDLPEIIPDVLFASSTQVVDGEALTFPPGMAFAIDTTREISTNIHFLNVTAEPILVEVAYDFFTMPEERLDHELAAFVMNVNDFLIPPHETQSVGTTCTSFGGNIVSLMPHTHQYADGFSVDVLGPTGDTKRIYEDGAFDLESDIGVYDPSVVVTPDDQLRYECQFRNTTDHDIVWGLGENEMCVLFGYIYPVEKQFVAYSEYQGEPCYAFQIGLFR